MPAVLAGALAFQGVSSIAGGISARSAADQQAKLQQEQGGIALKESQTAATNEAYNQSQAVGKQRLAYLANGVSLEGSPATVLEASRAYGQSSVQAILDQGAAQFNLAQKNAAVTRNQGRAALIAGVAQGVGSAATAYKYGTAGAFDTPAKGPTVSKKAVGGGP